MAPILAVASLTVRESLRRRAFLVMAFFAVFLLASSAFFPSLDAAGRVHLVESWGLRATLLFGILLVVFLASLSLPQDIEEKKVFMLITKPLSRPALYAGKWLGFAALLAMFLAAMGGATWGYARFVAWKGGPVASRALDVRERILAPSVEVRRETQGKREAEFSPGAPPQLWVSGPGQDFIAWHFKGLTFTAWPEGCQGRTLRVRLKTHVTPGPKPLKLQTIAYTRLKNPRPLHDKVKLSEVEDGDEIVLDLDVRNFDPQDGDMRFVVLQKQGEERSIGGSPLDATAVLINHFASGDELEYTYTAFSTVVGTGMRENRAVTELEALHNPKTDVYTLLVHRSPPLLARWVFSDLAPSQFDRDATVEVRLPIKGPMFRKYGYVIVTVRSEDGKERDRRKLRVATNTATTFPLDPGWLGGGSSLVVEVERGEPDTIYILVPDGVALRSRYVAFESGLLRALALVYLELLLLLAIVLPCSTWLSGPVSLLVGIALFICGMSIESIQENLIHQESVIRTTEVLESTRQEMHHHGGLEYPVWSLKASRFLVRRVLTVFPELHRFEGAPLLLAGVQIPASRVGWAAVYVGIYTLVTSALGMLILRFRDYR